MSSNDDSDFEVIAGKDLTDYNDAGFLPQKSEIQAEIQKWLDPTKYFVVTFALFCNGEVKDLNHVTSRSEWSDVFIPLQSSSPSNTVGIRTLVRHRSISALMVHAYHLSDIAGTVQRALFSCHIL